MVEPWRERDESCSVLRWNSIWGLIDDNPKVRSYLDTSLLPLTLGLPNPISRPHPIVREAA